MPAPSAAGERRRFFRLSFLLHERRRGNRRALLGLVAVVALFGLCDRYLLGTGRITDVSMLPTLPQGRYLVIDKWSYQVRAPRRGEIVVFKPPGQTRWSYIKRVVGLSGETLSIRSGRVHVEDRPLEEPYAIGKTDPEMGPIRIPEGSYFVLGDNRAGSEDSRHFGAVPRTRILGKI